MARFRYSALTMSGASAKGIIEAADIREAAEHLLSRGETPTRIEPSLSYWGLLGNVAPKRKELAGFMEDLAALHEAGVPLRRALDVLSGGQAEGATRSLAKLMAERLDSGADIGTAARIGTESDVMLAAEFARAGEHSGRLHETLRVGASILSRQAIFAEKIRGALAYPLFLLCLSFVVIIALSAFAGPALAPLLEEASGDAAALRQIISFGEFLRQYGLVLGFSFAVLVVTFAVLSGRSPMRRWLAIARSSLPFVGQIVRDLNCGAFARTFGALMTGGAPAARALDLAASSVPNGAWREKLLSAGQALREGRAVAAALLSVDGLPPELTHLARVGEETGALGEMSTRAGELILERALRRLDLTAAAAGPLLLVVMGAFIAWMMSAFFGGLSSLGDVAL
jgi:type II secretory pathway component PulF